MNAIYSVLTSPWFYWVFLVVYFITIIGIAGVIVSENRNPLKSLAWVTVLFLFPIGGVILYIFFGRSIKNTAMISRRNKRRLRNAESADPKVIEQPSHLPSRLRQQVKLARSLTGGNYYRGNSVEIFNNGTDKFKALIQDLKKAHSYIHIQYYIFNDDEIGTQVAEVLKERARAGVRVRVIYDDIGSIHVKKRFFKEMREAGIDVHPFFRVAFPPFATRINWRNHRKLCIIDGETGYIGGMNIADRYIDGGKQFDKWRDLHLRIKGPALNALQYSFAVDWNFMGQPLIEESVTSECVPEQGAGIQMITSGPTSRWSNVAMVFLKAIAGAKKRVYIQTPYFLPTESLLKTLQAAALSNVDVRIMIPRKSDSLILTNASLSYVSECIRAGIKIYLYNGGMLHSKAMIVDDEFSTVGSTNFDFRSFEHNFEGNVLIYSKDVNARLCRIFMDDLAESIRIRASQWRRRPAWQKAKESIVRLLSPIL